MAKTFGAFYFLLGLIFSLFFIAIGVSVLMFDRNAGGQAPGIIGTAIGSLVVIFFGPVFYGVIGFVFGAIGAFLYNIVAGMAGGIEFEIEV